MKRRVLESIIILCGFIVAGAGLAQQPKPKALDDVEIQATYPSAGTIVYRLGDGILEYTLTAGRMMGAGGVDLDYSAREIGDGMYLVSWHDEAASNYISLVVDLKNKVEYTTAIMAYGSDSQRTFVTEGVIDKVTWLE